MDIRELEKTRRTAEKLILRRLANFFLQIIFLVFIFSFAISLLFFLINKLLEVEDPLEDRDGDFLQADREVVCFGSKIQSQEFAVNLGVDILIEGIKLLD